MTPFPLLLEPAPLRAALPNFRHGEGHLMLPTFSVNQTQAAKKLGVTREHLNRVLRGHRQSRRLMAAFQKLQRAA